MSGGSFHRDPAPKTPPCGMDVGTLRVTTHIYGRREDPRCRVAC
jgi:hypothetical protein